MPIQDTIGATYPTRLPAGYPGMIADGSLHDSISKVVETAVVAFGLAVGRGTADGSVKLSGTGFEGITADDKTRTVDSYAIGEQAAVIRKGIVWVTASTAGVDPSKAVTFTAATGVIGDALLATITGAKFLDTVAIGGLVRVYLP